ncbi:MAG: TonB-dependent receptor, partial [Planctomycetia bacterium]|nr:TonB-dependent receptor [Planctomycetia bacterium]
DFFDLDIEQLRQTSVVPAFETVVTSVSRQESTVGRSPAAVFVITNEMILRSGARSIPEALRLAPGLHVAKINGSAWAISSRGFNDRFANKLLVQIDGRTVYTPLFAGVYWDVQDALLEDVARIEVIRGPGATIWGANAVNGVINVITKQAKDTVGVYGQAGGGTEEAGFAGARIGGSAADGDVHWRAWGKWFERDRGFRPEGPTYDDWRQGRGGIRMDWTPNCSDTVTLQGDYYQVGAGVGIEASGAVTPVNDSQLRGGNVLARWTRELSDTSDWSLQTYFDRTARTEFALDQNIDTIDIDFQHRFAMGARHNVIWGLAYRNVSDNLVSPVAYPFFPTIGLAPERRRTELLSAFAQDEVTLVEDKLFFTIGAKLQENDFTGFEVQPSARILWAVDPTHAVWGGISRAVRTPSRVDDDLVAGLGPPGIPAFYRGSRNTVSEELWAHELGYREQPHESFSWDVALFYNVYDKLGTSAFVFPDLLANNDMQGESYGAELTGQFDITPCWRLSGAYSFLRAHIHPGPTSVDTPAGTEGSNPRNQVRLWSSWDLGRNWQCDAIARYVDNVPAQMTPHYITMDLRLAWHASRDLEFAVVGQNLLDAAHKEYGQDFVSTQFTEVQRGVYGSATWRY